MKKLSVFFSSLAVTTMLLVNINVAIAGEAGPIKLLTPIGGEKLKVGETFRICWTPKVKEGLRLYIYDSNVYGGNSFEHIYDGLVDASQGCYDWKVDDKAFSSKSIGNGDKYQILIDNANGEPIDSSFAFSIVR